MSAQALTPALVDALRQEFGDALQEHAPLAAHVTARTGGIADALLSVQSIADLSRAAQMLWQAGTPFRILGSGSNVLIADQGVRGVVILNRARALRINTDGADVSLWAESGANFSGLARKAALQGFSGLEWAAAIPGTLGGAVYGNAGAFGGDMAGNLLLADILHPERIETVTVADMDYGYRISRLKHAQHGQGSPQAVILSATLHLIRGDIQQIHAQMERNVDQRKRTQPPGASMGSMFKNPPGDYAGRLIEAAGLKGAQRGGVQISPLHANFFIHQEDASAADTAALIQLVQETVIEKFGVRLDLEVECLGDWPTPFSLNMGAKTTA